MPDDCRCFHSRKPEEQETTEFDGTELLEGVVACQHIFGVGVYLPEHDAWGHINITALGVERVREGYVDHPPIGARLRLRALGRTPDGQLRLTVV